MGQFLEYFVLTSCTSLQCFDLFIKLIFNLIFKLNENLQCLGFLFQWKNPSIYTKIINEQNIEFKTKKMNLLVLVPKHQNRLNPEVPEHVK